MAQITNNTGTVDVTNITTANTAQNLFTGKTPINGFAVYNPDTTNDLWINMFGTALANGAGSIRVTSTTPFVCPMYLKPSQAISIVGGNNSQKFTAISY